MGIKNKEIVTLEGNSGKLHYSREGLVLKMVPEERNKYIRPDFIDIDEINFGLLEEIGKVCANFGLATNSTRYIHSTKTKKNYSEDMKKKLFLNLAAAGELQKLYSAGFETVFDLVHYYYTLYKGGHSFNETCRGKPSIEQLLGENVHEAYSKFITEFSRKAPLQVFYLHHMFQRYCCSSNLNLPRDNNTEKFAKFILNNYDLFNIRTFLQRTESRFFDDHQNLLEEYAKKKIRGLPKNEILNMYVGQSRGIPIGNIKVPKTKEYYRIMRGLGNNENRRKIDKILFPELFDVSQIGEVYNMNLAERAYILSSYPRLFENLSKEKKEIKNLILEMFPKFGGNENIVELLLNDANYSVHIQTRKLD